MVALYFRLIAARIKAQMQYKVSFWFELFSFALLTGIEFLPIALLLARFPSILGWQIAEIALLYGLTSIAFGLAEMIGRGFDAPFELMMQRGTFDGVMIRPLGSFFQILASEFQLRRLGRVLQGLFALAYAFSNLAIVWSGTKLLLLPLTLVAGTTIYMGLFVMSATLCFWTVKMPEVVNIFTFGGDYLVSYPLGIYNRLVRTIFLAIIPVAFVNYPTALFLLGRSDPYGLSPRLAWAAPLVAAIFFSVALLIWRFGVSKYQSTGT